MKKLLFCFALLGLAGCKEKPEFESIKLGDGSPAMIVHCHAMEQDECLTYVPCKQGYNLIATNYGNNKSFIIVSCK